MPFILAEVSPVGLVFPDFFLVFGTGSTRVVFLGDFFFGDWAPLEMEDFVFSGVGGFVSS